jgi:two-component system sensor histidine kinase BaeS
MVGTDIAGIVERLAGQFQSRAGQDGIEIQFTRAGELPLIQADPIRVEQILTNLLGNALKFTPSNGKVSVDVSGSSDGIDIAITDNGPGIPADSLPFIFDRFYKVDQSRSREEGGSGLGLAIARQLARAQGGDITARNRSEGGAVFTFHIPVRRDPGKTV